jgi:hypothetical protein
MLMRLLVEIGPKIRRVGPDYLQDASLQTVVAANLVCNGRDCVPKTILT